MLNELRGQVCTAALKDLLIFMRVWGSSVDLNYGEDNGSWECSWINGGTRFTDFANDPDQAVRRCVMRVIQKMERHQPATATPEDASDAE